MEVEAGAGQRLEQRQRQRCACCMQILQEADGILALDLPL